MTETSFEICIPATHPALSGHFPGDPIVPGALLLAEIGVRLTDTGMSIAGVRKVRFSRPVRPADRIEVRCRVETEGQLRFECRVADDVAARGSLIVAGRDDDC